MVGLYCLNMSDVMMMLIASSSCFVCCSAKVMIMSIRIFIVFPGKCDDVLRLVVQYLGLDVPEYTRFVNFSVV